MLAARLPRIDAIPAVAGLRMSVAEGCCAMLPQTFTTGVFLTGFAVMLGADAWTMGLMAAIPALGQVVQLIAAGLLARGADRKAMTVWAASVSRYLWLPMAAVAFLPVAAGVKLALFLALYAASNFIGQAAGIAWTDWMSELVPERERGRYFGFRNAVCALVGMLLVLWGSGLMDTFKHANQQAQGFALLIAVAACGSLASQWALAHQAEPGLVSRPRRTIAETFRRPLADRRFLALTGAVLAWNVVVGITSPFCYPYAMQHLHWDYRTLGLHTTLVTALTILSQPLWGRVIDRYGAQRTLVVAMGLVCLNPLYWVLMRPDWMAPLWIDGLASGLAWPGVALATFSLLMEVAPAGERAAYMGVFNTVTGIGTSLAAVAGGALLGAVGDRVFSLGGLSLLGLQGVFLLGILGRVIAFLGMRAIAQLPLASDSPSPSADALALPLVTIETRLAPNGPPGLREAATAVAIEQAS